MTRGILWEGSSPVDGAPIVAIATDGSKNAKTGPMIQVWILRADIAPHDAVESGDDASICGTCPMRGNASKGVGRACYVRVSEAPLSVYRAYKRGAYQRIEPSALAGQSVRLGAYGDPAMLPEYLVREIHACARLVTGYTHQWRAPWAAWTRGMLMASCDSQRDEDTAVKAGWATFRVGLRDGSDRGASLMCPSEYGAKCSTCGVCSGRAHVSVYIPAHGAGAGFVPAERLSKKGKAA